VPSHYRAVVLAPCMSWQGSVNYVGLIIDRAIDSWIVHGRPGGEPAGPRTVHTPTAAVQRLADADAVPGPHIAREGRLRRRGRARTASTSVDIAWSGGFAPHGRPTDSFSPSLNAPCGVQ
jgi:hypothetical protein